MWLSILVALAPFLAASLPLQSLAREQLRPATASQGAAFISNIATFEVAEQPMEGSGSFEPAFLQKMEGANATHAQKMKKEKNIWSTSTQYEGCLAIQYPTLPIPVPASGSVAGKIDLSATGRSSEDWSDFTLEGELDIMVGKIFPPDDGKSLFMGLVIKITVSATFNMGKSYDTAPHAALDAIMLLLEKILAAFTSKATFTHTAPCMWLHKEVYPTDDWLAKMDASSPADCMMKCYQNSACINFNYYKSTVFSNCYLVSKGGVVDFRTNNDAISGPSFCGQCLSKTAIDAEKNQTKWKCPAKDCGCFTKGDKTFQYAAARKTTVKAATIHVAASTIRLQDNHKMCAFPKMNKKVVGNGFTLKPCLINEDPLKARYTITVAGHIESSLGTCLSTPDGAWVKCSSSASQNWFISDLGFIISTDDKYALIRASPDGPDIRVSTGESSMLQSLNTAVNAGNNVWGGGIASRYIFVNLFKQSSVSAVIKLRTNEAVENGAGEALLEETNLLHANETIQRGLQQHQQLADAMVEGATHAQRTALMAALMGMLRKYITTLQSSTASASKEAGFEGRMISAWRATTGLPAGEETTSCLEKVSSSSDAATWAAGTAEAILCLFVRRQVLSPLPLEFDSHMSADNIENLKILRTINELIPELQHYTGNDYHKVNSHTWGGICTCPDGLQYFAVNAGNSCDSLNCDGGTMVPGSCDSSGGFPKAAHGYKVSCKPAAPACPAACAKCHGHQGGGGCQQCCSPSNWCGSTSDYCTGSGSLDCSTCENAVAWTMAKRGRLRLSLHIDSHNSYADGQGASKIENENKKADLEIGIQDQGKVIVDVHRKDTGTWEDASGEGSNGNPSPGRYFEYEHVGLNHVALIGGEHQQYCSVRWKPAGAITSADAYKYHVRCEDDFMIQTFKFVDAGGGLYHLQSAATNFFCTFDNQDDKSGTEDSDSVDDDDNAHAYTGVICVPASVRPHASKWKVHNITAVSPEEWFDGKWEDYTWDGYKSKLAQIQVAPSGESHVGRLNIKGFENSKQDHLSYFHMANVISSFLTKDLAVLAGIHTTPPVAHEAPAPVQKPTVSDFAVGVSIGFQIGEMQEDSNPCDFAGWKLGVLFGMNFDWPAGASKHKPLYPTVGITLTYDGDSALNEFILSGSLKLDDDDYTRYTGFSVSVNFAKTLSKTVSDKYRAGMPAVLDLIAFGGDVVGPDAKTKKPAKVAAPQDIAENLGMFAKDLFVAFKGPLAKAFPDVFPADVFERFATSIIESKAPESDAAAAEAAKKFEPETSASFNLKYKKTEAKGTANATEQMTVTVTLDDATAFTYPVPGGPTVGGHESHQVANIWTFPV